MRKEYDFRALRVKRRGPIKELQNAARSDVRAPKRATSKLDRKAGSTRTPR